MGTRPPGRGEVWTWGEGADEALVLSIDSFNRSGMLDVVCLNVLPGDEADEEESPYAMVVEVLMDGETQERTVFFDDIFLIAKTDLLEPVWRAPDELLTEAKAALDDILTPTAASSSVPSRPSGFPRTSEIRFADLHIEGERDKPVVVISSDEFGRLVSHALVVACRVSSNGVRIYDFDVKLESQVGKVVCSHVQTVSAADLTYRTTAGGSHVTRSEADQIRAKVRGLLGL